MKFTTPIYSVAIAAALATTCALPCRADVKTVEEARAAGEIYLGGGRTLPIRNLMYRTKAQRQGLDSRSRLEAAARDDARVQARTGVAPRYGNASRAGHITLDFAPNYAYNGVTSYGEMDAPNGETWFYTLRTESDVIEHEFYNDYSLQAFTLTVYNEKGDEVGVIRDKMRYLEGETHRVPMCDLLPLITNTFFNDNPDDYEVVIAFAVNTPQYVVHYRSLAYTLGGAKDDDGNDQPIATLPELISDVLEYTSADGQPGYFFTLVTEHGSGISDGDYGNESFWEKWTRNHFRIDTYMKAGTGNEPKLIHTENIPMQQLPGDQESGGYALTTSHNNEPIMVFSKLREPLTDPYYSPYDDMKQREGNTLEIDIYRLGETPEKLQHTSIPFKKHFSDDVLFTYCGIGMLRWQEDVDWDHYGTKDGQAAFIVTTCNYLISTDGIDTYNFALYNPDGSKVKDIFKNVDSARPISNIEGFEPQHMFVTYDSNDGYYFNFVDMYSLTTTCKMNYQFVAEEGDDPDMITTNLDRVKVGDTYMYATEMRMPVEDENVLYGRIAWLTREGKFDHIDMVNLGPDVRYAQSFISPAALNPRAFYDDDTHEYMFLIKVDVDPDNEDSTKTIENLMIGQATSREFPQGRTLLRLTTGERGKLSGIYPYLSTKYPMLAIGYADAASDTYNPLYNVDFYYLPLGTTPDFGGIDQVEADDTVKGDGAIYNLQGIRVDRPGKGLYIVDGKKVVL